jgi:hypothetical protein
MDEKLSHHQFVGQLGTRIQKEYESTKAYQKPLWDKAIKYGVHHLSKDFRRIFMYISSKVYIYKVLVSTKLTITIKINDRWNLLIALKF